METNCFKIAFLNSAGCELDTITCKTVEEAKACLVSKLKNDEWVVDEDGGDVISFGPAWSEEFV